MVVVLMPLALSIFFPIIKGLFRPFTVTISKNRLGPLLNDVFVSMLEKLIQRGLLVLVYESLR